MHKSIYHRTQIAPIISIHPSRISCPPTDCKTSNSYPPRQNRLVHKTTPILFATAASWIMRNTHRRASSEGTRGIQSCKGCPATAWSFRILFRCPPKTVQHTLLARIETRRKEEPPTSSFTTIHGDKVTSNGTFSNGARDDSTRRSRNRSSGRERLGKGAFVRSLVRR